MIIYNRTSEDYQSDLPELVNEFKEHGGSLVEYRYVVSFGIYTRRSTKIEWVPEHASPHLEGLIASLPTLCLGWWSGIGVFCTIGAIITNLLGGINVTELFKISFIDEALRYKVLETINTKRKYQQWVDIGVGFFFVVIIYIIIANILSE